MLILQWVSERVMELEGKQRCQVLLLVSANFVGRLGGRPANRSLYGIDVLS